VARPASRWRSMSTARPSTSFESLTVELSNTGARKA
jgi:hypothetical protein